MTPPRVLAAARVSAGGNPGKDVGASLRGAAGTPPPTVCPGMGGGGSLPLIRPCGATFPRGGRQGLLLAAAQGFAGRRGRRPLRVARGRAAAGGRGGVGAPRPTDGDMETLWGLREQSFPGRRAVGAGHARPGGLRGHPSMVRSVGRGLDPSAGGYPGDGCWRKPPRGVGDAAPYGSPGDGRRREVAAGWGHPALRMGGYGNAVGFTWAPVPGPPRGRGRACPARGLL